jgi:hypothetical protein
MEMARILSPLFTAVKHLTRYSRGCRRLTCTPTRKWSLQSDSNQRPTVYKTVALPLCYRGKNSPALHLEHCCFLDTYPDFSAGRKNDPANYFNERPGPLQNKQRTNYSAPLTLSWIGPPMSVVWAPCSRSLAVKLKTSELSFGGQR